MDLETRIEDNKITFVLTATQKEAKDFLDRDWDVDADYDEWWRPRKNLRLLDDIYSAICDYGETYIENGDTI